MLASPLADCSDVPAAPSFPGSPAPRCAFCMCSVHLLWASRGPWSPLLGLRPHLSGFWLRLPAGKSPLSVSQLPPLLASRIPPAAAVLWS